MRIEDIRYPEQFLDYRPIERGSERSGFDSP